MKEISESMVNKSDHIFGVMTELVGNGGTASIQLSSLDESGFFKGRLKNLKLRFPWDEPLEGKAISGFIGPVGGFSGIFNVEE